MHEIKENIHEKSPVYEDKNTWAHPVRENTNLQAYLHANRYFPRRSSLSRAHEL